MTRRVKVSWEETIAQTAVIEVDDDDVTEDGEMADGFDLDTLADVEDADEYAVTDRTITSWKAVT